MLPACHSSMKNIPTHPIRNILCRTKQTYCEELSLKRWHWGGAVLAACISNSQKASAEPTRGGNSKQPNILWITTDDQRIDALGCYGSPWGLSPHLDALASRGVRVEQCVVQSVNCTPSRSALWTGLQLMLKSIDPTTTYMVSSLEIIWSTE